MTFIDKSLRQAKQLAKQGKIDDANALYMLALERFPSNKRIQEAQRALQLSLSKEISAAEKQKLTALYNNNRLREAHALASALLQSHGPSAYIHNILGLIFDKSGSHDNAIQSFEKALLIEPGKAEILSNLGQCLKNRGHFDRAIATLESAVAADPKSDQAYNNLGGALREINEFDGALSAFKRAAKLNPNLAEPLFNMGLIYSEMGEIDKAIEYCEMAREITPQFPEILRNLSLLRKNRIGDPIFEQLNDALLAHANNRPGQMHSHFGLGKAFDDAGAYEQAFEHFQSANEIGLALSDYNQQEHDTVFARIKKCFEGGVDAIQSPGQPALRPVFVLGMPRSGTSLVEQILASHDKAFGAGELPHLGQAAIPEIKKAGEAGELEKGAMERVRSHYLAHVKTASSKLVIIDKLPMNFRWIGFILNAIPEARIVHVHRDPMAVCWSIYRTYFPARGLNYQWSQDALAHYYNRYSSLMAFWHDRFPKQIFDLSYENLTENQERQTRALVEACGLDWDDRCLNFQNTSRIVRTASSSQVRQGMYKGSSQAWRNYESHLEPLKQALGIEGENSAEYSAAVA